MLRPRVFGPQHMGKEGYGWGLLADPESESTAPCVRAQDSGDPNTTPTPPPRSSEM